MSDSGDFTINHEQLNTINHEEGVPILHTNLHSDAQSLAEQEEFDKLLQEEGIAIKAIDDLREKRLNNLDASILESAAKMDEIEGVHSWKDEQERIEAYNRKLSRRQAIKVITGATAAFVAADPVDTVKNLFGIKGGTVSAQEIIISNEHLTRKEIFELGDIQKVFFGNEGFNIHSNWDIDILRDSNGNLYYEDHFEDLSLESSTLLVPTGQQIYNFLQTNNFPADTDIVTNFREILKATRQSILQNYCLGQQLYQPLTDLNPDTMQRGNDYLVSHTYAIYKMILRGEVIDPQNSPLEITKVIKAFVDPNFYDRNEGKVVPISTIPPEYIAEYAGPLKDYSNYPDIEIIKTATKEISTLDYATFESEFKALANAEFQKLIPEMTFVASDEINSEIAAGIVSGEVDTGESPTYASLKGLLLEKVDATLFNEVLENDNLKFIKDQGFLVTKRYSDPQFTNLQGAELLQSKALTLALSLVRSTAASVPLNNLIFPKEEPSQYIQEIEITKLYSIVFLQKNSDDIISSQTGETKVKDIRAALFLQAYSTAVEYLKANPDKINYEWSEVTTTQENSIYSALISKLAEDMYQPKKLDMDPRFETPEIFRPFLNIFTNNYNIKGILSEFKLVKKEPGGNIAASMSNRGVMSLRINEAGMSTEHLAKLTMPHEFGHAFDEENFLTAIINSQYSMNAVLLSRLKHKAFYLAKDRNAQSYNEALGQGSGLEFDYAIIPDDIALLEVKFGLKGEDLLKKAMNVREQLIKGSSNETFTPEEVRALLNASQAYKSEIMHRFQSSGAIGFSYYTPQGEFQTNHTTFLPTEISFLTKEDISRMDLMKQLAIVSHHIWNMYANKDLDKFSAQDIKTLLLDDKSNTEMILSLQKAAQKVKSSNLDIPIDQVTVSTFDQLSLDTMAASFVLAFHPGKDSEYKEASDIFRKALTKLSIMREAYNLSQYTDPDLQEEYFRSLSNPIKSAFADDPDALAKIKVDLFISMRAQMKSYLDAHTETYPEGINPFPNLNISANSFGVLVDDYINKLEAQFN